MNSLCLVGEENPLFTFTDGLWCCPSLELSEFVIWVVVVFAVFERSAGALVAIALIIFGSQHFCCPSS